MSKMDCRERVLTTLNLDEPNRVPCHTILIDANNVDIILGKPQITDFDTVELLQRDNPEVWGEELSNLIEGIETSVFSRMVEATREFGDYPINLK